MLETVLAIIGVALPLIGLIQSEGKEEQSKRHLGMEDCGVDVKHYHTSKTGTREVLGKYSDIPIKGER